jgi:hypothetical protein
MIATRKLVPTPRAADGLFIQPTEVGPDRELVEMHNRQRAASHGKYADHHCGDQNTVDKTGKYRCWTCNNVQGNKCVLVSTGSLAGMKGPSCGEYENQRAGDPEKWLKVLSVDGAGFADAANGRWGCVMCPYGQKAYQTDSLGNTIYCRVWECRVNHEVGCCRVNGNKENPLPKDWDTDMDPDDPWKKGGDKDADEDSTPPKKSAPIVDRRKMAAALAAYKG